MRTLPLHEEALVREWVREGLLIEKVSLSAPAGEAVKDALEEFEVAGFDIDDLQFAADMVGLAGDITFLAGASTAAFTAGVSAGAGGVGKLVGIIANGTNAAVYASRGMWFDATLSAVSTAPGGAIAVKGLKRIGGPVVKHAVIPAFRLAGSGVSRFSSKQIKTLVNMMDPVARKAMRAEDVLSLQRRMDKISRKVLPVLEAISEANFEAFMKARGLKMPKGGLGRVAYEKAFKKLSDKLGPFLGKVGAEEGIIPIIKTLSDDTFMKPLAKQLKAVKGGKKLAIQTAADAALPAVGDLAGGALQVGAIDTRKARNVEKSVGQLDKQMKKLEPGEEEVQTESNARQVVRDVVMSESKSIIKRLAHREVLTECMNDLITEKMILATVNDITAFKPEIRDWADVLVSELEKRAARMKDMSEKRRESIVNSLVNVAVKDLINTTGGMTSPSAAKFKRQDDEKKYQQMKRSRRLGY